GPSPFRPIVKGIDNIMDNLQAVTRLNPRSRRGIKVTHVFSNYYNLGSKGFRPNQQDFGAQQGYYTAGLTAGSSVMDFKGRLGTKLRGIRAALRTGEPRRLTLDALDTLYRNDGLCGLRIENTFLITLNDLPVQYRNAAYVVPSHSLLSTYTDLS
ncbi:hypothetical protein JCM5353_007139, partial [Sporobolomyces roseus]